MARKNRDRMVGNWHMRTAFIAAMAGTLIGGAGCKQDRETGMNDTIKTQSEKGATSDEKEIVAHIHGLFDAYIRKDREAIRRGHTADWRGFQTRSTEIVRGIDAYMVNADRILETMNGVRYELRDVEVHVQGNIAVVYYVASYWIRNDSGEEQLVPLRSVDIYRREPGGWNQCGSNISFVPDSPNSQDTKPEHTRAVAPFAASSSTEHQAMNEAERATLMADREAIWRALLTNDQEAIKLVIPEETIAINIGGGPWENRDAILKSAADFVERGNRLVRMEFPRTEIQRYGDVAILYSSYLIEFERDGERKSLTGRATEVFVLRDGRWLNPGWHLDAGQ